ncbi:hypothetical protein QEN19_004129 [Hanseniaspora menglaensis]
MSTEVVVAENKTMESASRGCESLDNFERPVKMNKALFKLKLLNLLRDLNKSDKEKVDDAFETKLLPFLHSILKQVETTGSFEIIEILQLLLNFSIQMNNNLSLINIIIKYFVVEKKNVALVLDINQQDQQGNTPLHLASYLNRFDICNLLLSDYKTIINDTILNNNNLQALELTNNFKLYTLMVSLRNDYIQEIASELRLAFNNRDFEHLNDILIENARNKELLDLNGIDPSTGDTVLIEFIKKGDIVMSDWILKVGHADPFARNDLGKLPKDYINEFIQFGMIKTTKAPTNNNSITTNQAIGKELLKILDNAATNQTMINLIQPSNNEQRVMQSLEKSAEKEVLNSSHEKVISMPQEIVEPPIMQGYLKKWTNFATGYKLRYFILNPKEGKLSYFKNKKDLWNCRGALDLRFCYVYLNCSEGLKFEITTQLIQHNTLGGNSDTLAAGQTLDLTPNKLPHEQEQEENEVVEYNDSGTNAMLNPLSINNTITWHLKGNHPVETNKWVWCIQGAIRYCKDKDRAMKDINKDIGASQQNSTRSVSIVSRNGSLNTKNGPEFKKPEDVLANKIPETVMENGVRSARKKRIELPSFQKKTLSELHRGSIDFNTFSDANSDLEDSEESDGYETEEDAGHGKNDEEFSDFEDGINDEILAKIQKNWVQIDNSIVLELNNLIDVVENMDQTESNATILETLNSIKLSREQINVQHHRMVSKNDKRITKLNKILKLWIQSVKELEFELISKDDRIEKLQRELRGAKKLLQLQGTNGLQENNDMPQENKISRGEIKDSARDQSFLNSQLGKNKNMISSTGLENASLIRGQSLNSSSSTHTEEVSSDDEFFDFDDFKAEAAANQPVSLDTSKETEYSKDTEMVLLAKDADKLVVDESLKKQVEELIDKYNVKTTREEAKIIKKTIGGFNNAELKRFIQILLDESFFGYEEGPRQKLKLSADERPKVSLWSVLKSMIGKDMTKMSLPVTFNEPTSFLQRVVEDMEYVEILDKASSFYQSSTLRLLYVAIFSVSPYASTQGRIAKPFNPLLGETFEFVEPWKNYRCIGEQVSHHPPIGAIYMDSPTWEYYGESNVDGNFNGRCFDFKHLGKWFINLKHGTANEEELYSFTKPNNQVIGILTGNPQVDNYGEMTLNNHTTGEKCVITFKARGWRSNHAYEVKGEVFNKKNEKEWVFGGHWNSEIFAKRCSTLNSAKEDKDLIGSANIKNTEVKFDGSKFLVWQAHKRPKSPFNLTQFAIQLNALPNKLSEHLPKTDTRLRPDQKCMEDGLYEKASSEKHRVEEKQRAARKDRTAKNITWEPSWFKKELHPVTKEAYWRYTNEYWQRRKKGDWNGKCPDIF